MYGLGDDYHTTNGLFTRELAAPAQFCTTSSSTNYSDIANNKNSCVNTSTSHQFPSSNLCVPELPLPNCTIPPLPLHIKLEESVSPAAFNFSSHTQQNHSSTSSASSSLSRPSSPQSTPDQSPPSLHGILPHHIEQFHAFHSLGALGADHHSLPPPAPPPLHHQQHDLREEQVQLAPQQLESANGDQQVSAFIMQQLYQQYILYLQNEITCLRQSHLPSQQQTSPSLSTSMTPQPAPSPSFFPSKETHNLSQPTILPATSMPPLHDTSQPMPHQQLPKLSGNTPSPRQQLYPAATTVTVPQHIPQQQQQKPMKFHLVQYSKQPTVEEFEARVNNGTSSPDQLDPSQQSATINKLQINPELLTMKQSEAARILGISPSMLSKRWREAMNGRKWPYRVHRKLQKEINSIVTLMEDNGTNSTNDSSTAEGPSSPVSPDMEQRLKLLSMYKDINSTAAYI